VFRDDIADKIRRRRRRGFICILNLRIAHFCRAGT
jgi:hypothetical protein